MICEGEAVLELQLVTHQQADNTLKVIACVIEIH